MSTIVKAHSPADLLALVPHLVGFEPTNSVVLVAFRGKRTCGALRLNLPAVEVAYKRVASFAIGTICKIPNVDGIAVVIFTADAFGASTETPQAAFAKVMMGRVRQSGFELREALCRGGDGWASYLDAESPSGGHPLTDITNSPIAANLSLPMPAAVPEASAAAKRRVAGELARYRQLDELPPQLEDLPLFVERALDWTEAEVDEGAALLLFVVHAPAARDATMLQWATSVTMGDDLWEQAGQPMGEDEEWDATMGNLMLGMGPRPQPERLEQAINLLARVVALAGKRERLAPLCMLAWLNWALGRGTIAGEHLDAALAIDPKYGMAEVLGMLLGGGLLPEWAFAASDSIESSIART